MPACDTVTIEGGGGSGPQPVITEATASIGSEPSTVETTIGVTNEGDEFSHGTATVEVAGMTRTLEMDIGAGTTGTSSDTFEDVADGEYTVTFTYEDDSGPSDQTTDSITVSGGSPGQDRSEVQVNDILLSNPANNELTVEFSIVNSVMEGEGETLDGQWQISIDGGTAENGIESQLAPGESVTIQQDFTDVASGEATVSVSTQHDSQSDTITISGEGGGDDPPIDDGPGFGDIPKEYLFAGAGIAALALIGGRGGGRTTVIPARNTQPQPQTRRQPQQTGRQQANNQNTNQPSRRTQ
jgi:hypothetical protein